MPVTHRNAKNVPRNAAMSSGRVVGDGYRLRQRYITMPAKIAGRTNRNAFGSASTPRSLMLLISHFDIYIIRAHTHAR